ncbi:expressed unknown protein [Seminavis robusta]|uniref:Uncharacterized protein n=1 Tax=Seminavis robusta TaxID=568900 RepID=A0A9N8HRK4_9STRA|nr:expressed unknown protein [Seminavis robusta]|eukprot:Sro1408_g270080.1 n/a (291) ;mRNA; r:11391-12358
MSGASNAFQYQPIPTVSTDSWRSTSSTNVGNSGPPFGQYPHHQSTSTSTIEESERLQAVTSEWDGLKEQLETFLATTTTETTTSSSSASIPQETPAGARTAHLPNPENTELQSDPNPQPRTQVNARQNDQYDFLRIAAPLPADSPDHWMEEHRILPHKTLNQTADGEAYMQQLVSNQDDYQRRTHFYRTPHTNSVTEYWQRLLEEREQAERDIRMLDELQQKEARVLEETGRVMGELQQKEQVLKEILAEFQELQQLQQEKMEELRQVKEERKRLAAQRQGQRQRGWTVR